MKDISQEVIEIDGIEYKLFLNRNGMVAYEKYVSNEQEKVKEIFNKYKDIVEDDDLVIDDNTNPFENIVTDEEMLNDAKVLRNCYIKLYWIMLYTNHQLSLNKVNELYEKACGEYGEEQVRALADQMVEEINTMPQYVQNGGLKNLPALKPKK